MARPKGFDRTATLDRAMTLFWHQGYEATSLTDLERHLGIGRQSIYDTFGNKLDLYCLALDRYSAVPVANLVGVLQSGGADAIRHFFERLIAYQAQPTPPACFMVGAAVELAQEHPVVGRRVAEHLRRLEAGFLAAYSRGRAGGELEGTLLESEAAARLLTCATLGLLVATKAQVPAAILRRTAVAALEAVGIPGSPDS